MAYTPGYIATITINGVDYQADAESMTITQTTNPIPKNTLGLPNEQYINGLKGGTFSVTLHMSTTSRVALDAANASTTPVPFIVRPGALGTFDNGQYNFSGILISMEDAGGFDTNWSVQLEAQITGAVTFTAPV